MNPGLVRIYQLGIFPSRFIRINSPYFVHFYPEKTLKKGKHEAKCINFLHLYPDLSQRQKQLSHNCILVIMVHYCFVKDASAKTPIFSNFLQFWPMLKRLCQPWTWMNHPRLKWCEQWTSSINSLCEIRSLLTVTTLVCVFSHSLHFFLSRANEATLQLSFYQAKLNNTAISTKPLSQF